MKQKILIIEDNADVRENLREILALSGYEAIVAANGKEGVEAALRTPPDLILCDIMMPELDGYGVLRILSKQPVTSSIPFIFLTARTDLGDMRRGMTLGADDYITKPFDDVQLLDTVELRLKKKSAGATAPAATGMFNAQPERMGEDQWPAAWLDEAPRTIHKKDALFTEGHTCRHVFLLRQGRAIATRTDAYSKEVVTRIYQAGDIAGTSSAFGGERYLESVKAFEDLTVVPVKKEEFLKFALRDTQTAYYFLHQLAHELGRADEKLLLQAFGSVRMKLAATLIDLHATYATNGRAVIPVSREDLANMAGTAKETIIRCLSEFREEGLVNLNGSDIVIESVKPLIELQY